jgi:hypothetical protein
MSNDLAYTASVIVLGLLPVALTVLALIIGN